MHRFANLALVAVCGGSVNVAIARVKGGRDRAARLVGRRLEDTEADRGHLDTVVQGDIRYFVCHGDTPVSLVWTAASYCRGVVLPARVGGVTRYGSVVVVGE